MRFAVFAGRNFKEIVRDPVSILMGVGFPMVLIVILSLMKQNIGNMAAIFEVQNFAPSMVILGIAFLGTYVGTLMTNDRNQAFLTRLFATPLKGFEYILGYALPVLPLAVLQAVCCFAVAAFFGLEISGKLMAAVLVLLPAAVLFICFGLLMGSAFTSNNSVNGFGTILVNGAVFLSGALIPLDLVGGIFKKVCDILPFSHAVNAVQYAIAGKYSLIPLELIWVLGYSLLLLIPSIVIFQRKMRG